MTTDRFADLTAIVKRRYETGEYGDAHFKLPRAVYDEMRQHVPTPEPGTYAPPRLPGYSLGDLMGIPILIAEDLPEGIWQLVQTGSGEILRAGTIDQPDPDGERISAQLPASEDIRTGAGQPAVCPKCRNPLTPCVTCGKPALCGDSWCADCTPGDEPAGSGTDQTGEADA